MKIKRLICLLSGKGGVGKTTAACYVADRYVRDGLPALLVDGDKAVAGLLAVFGLKKNGKLLEEQGPGGVVRFAMHGGERDRDTFVNLLGDGHARVLVDTPAGSIDRFMDLDREVGFFDLLDDVGYRATFVSPITTDPSTIASVRDSIKAFGARADYVVVANHLYGEPTLWSGSNTEVALRQHKGVAVVMPKLSEITFERIRDARCRYSGDEIKGFQIADKARLAKWLKDMDAEFSRAAELLAFDK